MSTGEPTVVVVEDDANIAGLVELYLRDAGFRVSLADRGERALDLIRARPPSLVILDVGNGMKGGSPSEPKLVTQAKYDLNALYRDVEATAGPGFIR